VDEKKGLSSLGKSTCAVKKKSAHLFNQRIIKALPRLVHFTASSPNESIWNVMGIYRDKTVHLIGMRIANEKFAIPTRQKFEIGRFATKNELAI
jgi:hypothetical protein